MATTPRRVAGSTSSLWAVEDVGTASIPASGASPRAPDARWRLGNRLGATARPGLRLLSIKPCRAAVEPTRATSMTAYARRSMKTGADEIGAKANDEPIDGWPGRAIVAGSDSRQRHLPTVAHGEAKLLDFPGGRAPGAHRYRCRGSRAPLRAFPAGERRATRDDRSSPASAARAPCNLGAVNW
jgi:hypothetical protein